MTDTGASPPSPASPHRLDPPEPGALSDRLFPPLPSPGEWSLERVHALLEELGRPHAAYPSLHVGGTNGKGSVAAVWASVLERDGRRVGRYTSPHLVSFTERFVVGRRPVTEETLLAAARELEEGVVRHGLSFFEAATALAFHLFRKEEVDVAVVEVGLGGRLDATNVVRPAVSAVTNVAVDHAEYLGESLESIAREKGGIAKEGIPFVTGETQADVLEVLRRTAVRRGAPFHRLDPASVTSVETGRWGSRFRVETDSWGALELESSLVGRHQVKNVALAVRALDLMAPTLRPGREAVVAGVATARWPGRLQVEPLGDRIAVLDVAHNPAGTAALVRTLEDLELPRPRVAVFGCLADKAWRPMLDLLRPWGDHLLLTRPPSAPSSRVWDPEEALALWGPPAGTGVRAVGDLDAALEEAERLSGGAGTLLVAGSHFTVGAALRILDLPSREGDPSP